jgi:hypothetical protein
VAVTILDANSDPQDIYTATVGGDHVQGIAWVKQSRSDTYTATADGTAVDVSTLGMSKFSLQCAQTGTVTSWTVLLEVSLNGTNYVEIARHMKTGDGTETVEGNGAIAFTASPFPALYFRTRCSEITLGGGTNVIATVMGMP